MSLASRLAGNTVVFLIALVGAGPAGAQEARAAPVREPKINKVVIDNGLSQTVKYFVEGGSPRLQALVRTLQWAENEVTLVEQLQLLKMETVVNERRVEGARTSLRTGFGYSPYYASLPFVGGYGGYGGGESSLQGALSGQLAREATPEMAMQLIRTLEQVQTDLDAELKKLPHPERKAAQVPVAALRTRVASLPRLRQAPRQPLRVVPSRSANSPPPFFPLGYSLALPAPQSLRAGRQTLRGGAQHP